jgi:hypothetical protein
MGVRIAGHAGWAAVVLLAAACAHVLLELAGAVLAVAIAVRLLGRPVREAIVERVHSGRLLDRPRCEAAAVDRSLWTGQRGWAGTRPSRTPGGGAGSASHGLARAPGLLAASKGPAVHWKQR